MFDYYFFALAYSKTSFTKIESAKIVVLNHIIHIMRFSVTSIPIPILMAREIIYEIDASPLFLLKYQKNHESISFVYPID
jgi:hypothetical protein